MRAGYAVLLAVLAVDALLVALSLLTISRGNRLVEHSRQVLAELEHVLSALKDAETGQRGYLLSGRDEYLEPYRAAETELPKRTAFLRFLTTDDPNQRAQADNLARLVHEKLAELRRTIDLRREQGFDAALRVVLTDEGKSLMVRARQSAEQFRWEEDGLLAARTRSSQAAVRETVVTFAITTGTALLLLLAVGLLDRRASRQREHAALELSKSEAWLSTTLASIGDGVIATDVDGRVRFMNPVAEAATGWTQANAAGRPMVEVLKLVNEYTRAPVDHPVERVIREGVVVGLANHTVLIGRDGAERPIEDSAAPIRDQHGRLAGVVMVFRDATEARAAERVRAESERQFRTLADSIPPVAWMARPDGSVAWYNRRWFDYTGATPEQADGWGWKAFHDPGELPRVLAGYRAAIASGEPWEDTFPLRRKDGQMRWHLMRALPVRDEAGHVVRWFGTGTDVTDQRRAADELRRSAVELKFAKEEAEDANKAKDQFLAVLSHELRTPLNPILLAVSSMLDHPPPPDEVRPNLEMIRQYVNLQARLIDDLLDVMRIARGKMPLHWEVVDVHALLGQAIQICRSEVFGKRLRLDMSLDATHHHINADPARLQQVFWNLIKNAVKFTPEGGTITLRTRNEDDASEPHTRIVIEVADNGIGIDAEILDRIFDPFQQGETSITRKFGGMGLGLAISKGIIEGHGGLLSAASRGANQGSTLRVDLRTLPDPAPEALAPAPARAAESPPARPARLRVLLVEDEQATLRLMAKLLRGLGHQVTTAATIAEALATERAQSFELIISDIGLPDGSGLDLMRHVVAHRGPVTAIALTGYGMEEDIQRSREAGFMAHMTKPIDFTKLEAMIRQISPDADGTSGQGHDGHAAR